MAASLAPRAARCGPHHAAAAGRRQGRPCRRRGLLQALGPSSCHRLLRPPADGRLVRPSRAVAVRRHRARPAFHVGAVGRHRFGRAVAHRATALRCARCRPCGPLSQRQSADRRRQPAGNTRRAVRAVLGPCHLGAGGADGEREPLVVAGGRPVCRAGAQRQVFGAVSRRRYRALSRLRAAGAPLVGRLAALGRRAARRPAGRACHRLERSA